MNCTLLLLRGINKEYLIFFEKNFKKTCYKVSALLL